MGRKLIPIDSNLIPADKKLGWKRQDGSRVIANESPSIDTHILHVMWVDGDKILYDQILRCERGGGVFLPVDTEGRIGLVKQWRPQTPDMQSYQADWPNINVEKLGRESWELPRGFSRTGETSDQTAKRETQEETESVVISSSKLGEVCDNTAFSPHLTGVQVGMIDQSRKPVDKPDPNEKLLSPVTFFSLSEIKQMIKKGEIYDGYTLAALGMYFI